MGSEEEGQGTLCEDEADGIDEDRRKMAIYKNGYIKGFPVARTDTSFRRKQLKMNTFCWKAFAAERFPDPVKAKGFVQRCIELQCYAGNPDYDIAEVTNPAGEEGFQDLLDELNETQNLLLAYRLLHFHDKIPDIKLNIKRREKQLFKPVLRIFQNSKSLAELLPVISNYVVQKREANFNTLHAFLYRVIRDLIKDQKKAELTAGLVHGYIKSGLQGEDIPGKALSYETPEFGTISQKEITQTLEHIFGAKTKKVSGTRMIIFDITKLQRLSKVYDLAIQIRILQNTDEEASLGSDGADWTDVGIGRYIKTESDERENTPVTEASEHESSPETDVTDFPHPPNVSNPTLMFVCYHNDCDFHTENELGCQSHGALKHPKNPLLYPSKAEIEQYGLRPQGKDWEV